MAIVAHWNEWYQIEVCDWLFLKPDEAKTTKDSHHAACLTIAFIDTDAVDPIILEFMDNNKNNGLEDVRIKDMYNKLLKFVESEELDEDVPKITTIQNWISTYTQAFKEQATENIIKNL
ncbi:hypothetical protein RhiirA4_419897 [Rhizophagus irregularis]|uniref:Uncharacterized protein n=1 Tax=Rhizophagus irregularis TaxID=588596 RepID=A0A2I1GFW2_9GLOM|nr:hypothetical protein RhiirA4_419897 [Rhizophagus irregularis]